MEEQTRLHRCFSLPCMWRRSVSLLRKCSPAIQMHTETRHPSTPDRRTDRPRDRKTGLTSLRQDQITSHLTKPPSALSMITNSLRVVRTTHFRASNNCFHYFLHYNCTFSLWSCYIVCVTCVFLKVSPWQRDLGASRRRLQRRDLTFSSVSPDTQTTCT